VPTQDTSTFKILCSLRISTELTPFEIWVIG